MAGRGIPWVAFAITTVVLAGCVDGGVPLAPAPTYAGPDGPLRLQAPALVELGVVNVTGPGLRAEPGGLRGGTGPYMFQADATGGRKWEWRVEPFVNVSGARVEHVYDEVGIRVVRALVAGLDPINIVLRIAEDPDPMAKVRDLMAGVPCQASVSPSGTSANLKPLSTTVAGRAGHQSLDFRNNLVLANKGGGFAIYDVSDPRSPQVLGDFERGGADIKFSPDNLTALVGGGGITMVDIRNPADPVEVGRWSGGQHMHFAAMINGKQYVFVVDGFSSQGVKILRLDGPPDKRTLTPVAQSLPIEGGPLGPHDVYVTYEHDLKKWVLYAADGFHGWLAHDVSNPERPLPLGGFLNPEPEYVHSIQSAMVGNRRLVATIGEVGVNMLKVYDATILQAPVLLAAWQVTPGGADPQHDFNIVDGQLYLGHYTHGVYVFNLTKLGLPGQAATQLTPAAHWARASPGGAGALGFSGVWEAAVHNGVMYVADMQTGLHAVGYGCLRPGDRTLSSTG